MRRIFVLMAVMAVLVTDVAGKERTNGEMLSIARETLFRGDAAKAKGANVELRQVRDSRQLGVFTADGYGFVVVNRDDAGRTILGLSATDYDADNMPDGLKWWLENTEDALANGIKGSFYADILNVDAVIDNFITTKWNQQAPFNNKCPMVTSGSKSRTAPTGCVATALSQVMNYYKYPEQGKGEGTYSVTNDKKTTSYTVNISGTYDYNSLKDTYSRSETDDEAISTLSFEVGAACAMEYGYSGSGTSFIKAAQAMANNFSYDSLALNYHYGGHYLEDEWLTMIRKEMEANRPVLYGSADPTYGGHAFLFTGLDTEGKVWINWGWGGDGDGWFAIDQLTVNQLNFCKLQQMLTGFVPRMEPTEDEENLSYILYLENKGLSLALTGNTVYINSYSIVNYSWRVFKGEVRCVVENRATGDKAYRTIFGEEKLFGPFIVRSYKIQNNLSYWFKKSYPNGFPEGNYKVYMECKSTEEKEWQTIRREGDLACYSWFSVNDDGTVIVDNESPTTVIGDVKTDTVGENMGTYDLGGRKVNGKDNKTTRMVIRRNGKGVEKILEIK